MTEEAALLRTVLETPGDDTARLVYADWLAENGREDRAEFIRNQIEVALCGPEHGKIGFGDRSNAMALQGHGDDYWSVLGRVPPTLKKGDVVDVRHDGGGLGEKLRTLRGVAVVDDGATSGRFVVKRTAESGPWKGTKPKKRADELLAKYEVAWRMGPKCPRCEGKGSETVDGYSGVCPNCLGSGYTGSLSGKMSVGTGSPPSDDWKFQIPATWSRGLVHCVTAPLAAFRHAAWVIRLWNEWPVTEVVTNKVPEQLIHHDGYHWSAIIGYRFGAAAVVGPDVFDAIDLPVNHGMGTKFAPSRALAEAALSRAVVKIGRRSAGLSP